VARVYVQVHWYWPKGVARFQLVSRQFSAFAMINYSTFLAIFQSLAKPISWEQILN